MPCSESDSKRRDRLSNDVAHSATRHAECISIFLPDRETMCERICWFGFANGFAGVAEGILQASQSLDRDVGVDVIRLADNLEIWRAPSRIAAGLSGVLGALALLPASIGVYGNGVVQRAAACGRLASGWRLARMARM
jgi:hypothetical protein